jgi:hypothetical protein
MEYTITAVIPFFLMFRIKGNLTNYGSSTLPIKTTINSSEEKIHMQLFTVRRCILARNQNYKPIVNE